MEKYDHFAVGWKSVILKCLETYDKKSSNATLSVFAILENFWIVFNSFLLSRVNFTCLFLLEPRFFRKIKVFMRIEIFNYIYFQRAAVLSRRFRNIFFFAVLILHALTFFASISQIVFIVTATTGSPFSLPSYFS